MEKFLNLEEEKRRSILDAALKEFAENGFKKASTNRMVKDAGIGKGMLFYYFKSKGALYEFLVEYSLDIIINEYLERVDTKETDFIARLQQAAQVKMIAQRENEQVFNFMGAFMLNGDVELPKHLQKRYEALQILGNALLYEGIDTSLLRDDVDPDKAFKLIRWSIEGFQTELVQRLQGEKMTAIDFDPYWEEFYDYLHILKKTFYKEQED
jgi:TetR/AcrR family transcriptional regulator